MIVLTCGTCNDLNAELQAKVDALKLKLQRVADCVDPKLDPYSSSDEIITTIHMILEDAND